MNEKGKIPAIIERKDQLIENEVPCDVTSTDYCGNFIYENGTLKRILIPGGYVTFANDNINLPEYHFYITDHQGNIRVVANAEGTIEQVNHYYPYGGLMGESINSDTQPYKYNGNIHQPPFPPTCDFGAKDCVSC